MKLEELKQKKILILGYGKEGKDSFNALKKLFPKSIIEIADKNVKGIKHSGKDYLKHLDEYDVVIKTPGIPISRIKTKALITTQTKIFFDNFEGLTIGVTGTKGKGTTSSLIYNILKKAGKPVHLVGNIGNPVFKKLLSLKKTDIVIYELSSHQLQTLKKSPQIAVFLNLFPDHLEYYKGMGEYKKAKENIFLHQTEDDFLITNLDFKSKSTKIKIKGIIPTKKIPLKGKFNELNILASIKVAELLKVSPKYIKEGIETFKPLPHRLEYIGKYKGIEFYNDSMSTIPEVTLAAILAVKPDIIMLGGSYKGSDYKELKKAVKNIKTVIALGDQIQGIKVTSMREAVKEAYKAEGKVCLMSPGAASFNIFLDYKDRGDQFKKWVKYYGKKKKV